MRLNVIVLILTALLCSCESLKILGLFPHHGRSHHDVFEPLLLTLAGKGHQITVVSHFNPKEEPQGWRFISMGNFSDYYRGIIDLVQIDEMGYGNNKIKQLINVLMITQFGREMCDVMTKLPEVKEMLDKGEKFDVIFVEQFNSDCSLGIANILNTTVIGLQSHTIMPWTFDRFSQPEYLAFIPNLFSDLPPHMSFLQRLENTVFHYMNNFIYQYYSLNMDQKILQNNLKRKIPNLEGLAKNISLLLSNTHYTFHGVKPLVPSIVEVAGIHLKRNYNTIDKCFNILGLFPYIGRSHHDVFEPLLARLVKSNHKLTIASHFPPKIDNPNWYQINLSNNTNMYSVEVLDLKSFSSVFGRHLHILDTFFLADISMEMCNMLTTNQEVKYMVDTKMKFDLILVEHFISDCGLGVAHLLDAPVVALQSHTMMPWSYDMFDQPDNPAYIPNLFLRFGPKMNFFQRVENTIFRTFHKYFYENYVLRNEREIIQRNLNHSIPSLRDIAKNTSAMLTNTHYTLNGVKPFMPSVVEVGGMHIRRTLAPLSLKIETFMNESTHGVILFSMGSMIKASSFPADKLRAITETFATLKERVIWKWEAEPPPRLSKNVYIVKWAPQMEILHHPKTVAFISHGGLLGTTESLHAGVPMLFIPVFGDQFVNSAAGQENGLGVMLPYTEINKQQFHNALGKVLTPEMRASAKSLSDEWRDRPDPLDVAVAEVERVARHGGKRRRSPARDLLPHQVLLLDVILFLIVFLLLFIYIIYKLLLISVKVVCFFIKSKKSSNQTGKSKKE